MVFRGGTPPQQPSNTSYGGICAHFFCAYTPEYLCETLPDLCETKIKGVAATQISNCDGETLCETDFPHLPISAYACQYKRW